jgi:molybdopterin converting factor small subunit
VPLPAGATLATLIDVAERRGIRLREALETSPHLRHTLMLNGERCPVDQNADRKMTDGDEVYLLAPLAGG